MCGNDHVRTFAERINWSPGTTIRNLAISSLPEIRRSASRPSRLSLVVSHPVHGAVLALSLHYRALPFPFAKPATSSVDRSSSSFSSWKAWSELEPPPTITGARAPDTTSPASSRINPATTRPHITSISSSNLDSFGIDRSRVPQLQGYQHKQTCLYARCGKPSLTFISPVDLMQVGYAIHSPNYDQTTSHSTLKSFPSTDAAFIAPPTLHQTPIHTHRPTHPTTTTAIIEP